MTDNRTQANLPRLRESFSTIRERLVGKYYMADSDLEAICPEAHERPILRELLVRAHVDPDFRFDLIWNVGEALGQVPGGCPKGLTGISFRDETSNAAQEIRFDALESCICLMLPAWRDLFNRGRLEAMID
jgi:hypothetical protein